MFLSISLSVLLLCVCFSPAWSFDAVSFAGCGTTKGCMQSSAVCTETTCAYAVSWRVVVVNNKNYMEFELSGNVYNPGGYIAVGISTDKMMGDDGVLGCVHDQSSSSVLVKVGYNTGVGTPGKDRGNRFISSGDLGSDFLLTSGNNLGGQFNPITNMLSCRFQRLLKPDSRVENMVKDLSGSSKYFLLVARGKQVGANELKMHAPGSEVVSKDSVALASMPLSLIGSSSVNSPLAKTHGCLMIIAWVLCASVGIILARYYKELWPNTGLAGESVWFQMHRSLQSCCVILTTISFILIFIHVGGYSQLSGLPFLVHPILGIIVFILAFLNPLIALCRCIPQHKNRPVFNWIHFFVGTIAYVLSVPTMMLGLRLPAAGTQLPLIDYPLWILIFFVIFQVVVELILEIHGCIYYRRNKDKRLTYENEFEEYQAAIRVGSGPQPRPREPEPAGRVFKYFMLGLHATVAALVAVILVIIVCVN